MTRRKIPVTAETTTDSKRWAALYVLCASVLMIVLDATIVNVALPSIQDDLGFSQSGLAWVVNAYLIAFGGLLLLSGRIGDLIGQRKIFLIGLAVFTSASLLCAVAQNEAMLISARFIQGAGGALTSAVILGMIVTMFPEPKEQAKAIGVYGFVASGGGSIGLLLGGFLTEISWHWIFLINVPIGLVTAFLAVRLVESRPGIGLDKGADLPGALLLIAGLMLGTYTILGVEQHGWGSAQTLGLGALSMVLLGSFIFRQSRIENPLMPLSLFKSRAVSGANAIQALLVVGMFGMFFLGALYVQRVLHYSPIEVGLAFLPTTLVMGFMSLKVSGPFSLRYGLRATLVPSFLAIGLGLVLFARTPVDASYVLDVLPPMVLVGFGAGFGFPALAGLAMSGVEPSQAGLASGLVNTSAQVGGAIGLAVLATFAAQRTETLTGEGKAMPDALVGGYHLAYMIGIVFVVAALAVTFYVTKPSPATATEGAHGAPHGGDAQAEAA
jgi:EmrB/QacA subfamily drug resistance transporter